MVKDSITIEDVKKCIADFSGNIYLDIGNSTTDWKGPWRTQICIFHHGAGRKAKQFLLCFENGVHSECLVEIGSNDSQVGYTFSKKSLKNAVECYNEKS